MPYQEDKPVGSIVFNLRGLEVVIHRYFFELSGIPFKPLDKCNNEELATLVRMAFYEGKDPAGELYNLSHHKIKIVLIKP